MGNGVTIAEGAQAFLSGLTAEDRQVNSQEVNRFTHWYGANKLFGDVEAYDIEMYCKELESSTSDPSHRVEALRAFLTFARQQGWTKSNLVALVRIRRQPARKVSRAEQRPSNVVQLTQEGHRKVKDELDGLLKERPKIVDELQRARADKDFRENAPLDAARQHQAQVEGRIRSLEATLKASVIIQDEHKSETKAGMGSKVVVRDLIYEEDVTYMLVSPSEVDLKRSKISVASPTGKALLDKQAGDEVEVIAPAGIMRYRIERVER